MGFIDQSHVQSPITDLEFFESEKQINHNQVRKIYQQKNPFAGSQAAFSKAPIKIMKQKIPPHLEVNKKLVPVLDEKISLNKSKDSNNSESTKSENSTSSIHNKNIKMMFGFLKEKIGEKLSEQLLSLINFSSEEGILKSLVENDEKIKKILGSYYNQVVNLIMHIVKLSPSTQTPTSNKTQKNEDNSLFLEDNIDFVRAHKKHYSVGGKSAFAKKF
jgi:hypothetical protein